MERELEKTEGRLFNSLRKSNFGDVMVVGGGISGIQASLDLATAGIPEIFIVEEYSDEETIKKFNPPALPAIIVDGKLKSSGKYLTKDEIKKILKEEFEASRK